MSGHKKRLCVYICLRGLGHRYKKMFNDIFIMKIMVILEKQTVRRASWAYQIIRKFFFLSFFSPVFSSSYILVSFASNIKMLSNIIIANAIVHLSRSRSRSSTCPIFFLTFIDGHL